MKREKSVFEITFNEWARNHKVSTLWDNTKAENRHFLNRLRDAREGKFLLTHKA